MGGFGSKVRDTRGRVGNLQSQVGSPLPQEEGPPPVTPVNVVNGWYQFLPSEQTTFFQRPFFAQFPNPLVIAGGPNYPRPIPIIRIESPAEQCVIVQDVSFKVYQHTGVDPQDIIEVDPSRCVTVFGFQFAIGNRGVTNLTTNVTARGDLINTGKGFNTFAPQPGQGSFYPFAGLSQLGLRNFAAYARPGQTIQATVQVLRPPPFDVRLFSCEVSGFTLSEYMLDKVLGRTTGR